MKDDRMDNIVECAYNMDNGYVEVWFIDGNMLRIKCEEVEAALRTTEQSLAKLHKLLDEGDRVCGDGTIPHFRDENAKWF